MRRLTACLFTLALFLPQFAAAQTAKPVDYATLTAKTVAHGFQTVAVYLDPYEQPFGARFRDTKTGFTMDLLRIESVPQGYLWANTFPTSNMGEPHTQEHLLLGHGNKGRNTATQGSMAMLRSSAHTEQQRTVYHFNTPAGPDVFFRSLEIRLDALLHPDYTDEEIRREVRNFGIVEDPRDKRLRLEEKGSVYNEMVSSMTQPGRIVYYTMREAVYGPKHPLAFNAGGAPADIRVMQPEHIRKFHRDNYYLANMAMVLSLPKQVTLDQSLRRMREMLDRVQPAADKRPPRTEASLPAPAAWPEGTLKIVEFPHKSDTQPGPMGFVWPADLKLTPDSHTLLMLFVEAFGSDATTNLHKLFVDTATRKIDLGAKNVSMQHIHEAGSPIYVFLTDVNVTKMDAENLGKARELLLAEIERVSKFADGSPELAEFNDRVRSRIIQAKRQNEHLINSPPQFGFRLGARPWQEHLDDLNDKPGFRKQVNEADHLKAIGKMLDSGRNIWRERIAEWKLLTRKPHIVAGRPNPALIEQDAKERMARSTEETARLKAKYGASTDEEALRRYREDYDANTAAIEKARVAAKQKFLDNPPLTYDDQLSFAVRTAAKSVPNVVSTFDSITAGTVGIALRLDGVPEEELVYLALLPALLTQTGVIVDGKSMTFEAARELQRKEILSLTASFASNTKNDRVELTMRGQGNDAAETQRAIEWMKRSLTAPNWRMENLSRIRDVVDQSLTSLRNTMQMAEENWVRMPATAWRKQQNAVYVTATNFLTRAHFAHRLRWMLKGDSPDRDAVVRLLEELEPLGEKPRVDIRAKLAELRKGGTKLAIDAATDLDALLADIPDDSLKADWTYLCGQMRRDLKAGPQTALAGIERLRDRIARAGNARLFEVASKQTQQALAPSIDSLIASLSSAATEKVAHSQRALVRERLQARMPGVKSPAFVGLIAPSMSGGVLIHEAPGADFEDTGRDAMFDYLASLQFAGSGSQSAFMRTWGAGLAYSNGLNNSPASSRLAWYAERTPEAPQTARFVANLVETAKHDPDRAEYAIATAFVSRADGAYESRGEAIAADLADGQTPDKVASFRKAILSLRTLPTLSEELHGRMKKVNGRILPGLGTKLSDVPDGLYFLIGSEKQFAAWEQYLRTIEGADTQVPRLYPRDFWITQ